MKAGKMSSNSTDSNKTASRKDLRVFGIGLGVILGLVTGVLFWKGRTGVVLLIPGALSILFAVTGILAPGAINPVYRLWMPVARAVGWFNTRLILMLVYFLVLTPMGIILRLFGWDPLRLKNRETESYWIVKDTDPVDRERYLKQF